MGKAYITGIGIISIIGQSLDLHKEALKASKSMLKRIFQDDFESLINTVSVENPKNYIKNKKAMRFYGLDTVLGCVATSIALSDANISKEEMEEKDEDTGLIIGSTYVPTPLDIGAALSKCMTLENTINYQLLGEIGMRELPPLWMLSKLPNTAAGQISIENNIRGINYSIVNGMNSGMVSIGEAFLALKHNRAKRIICGGVESNLQPEYLSEVNNLNLVAHGAESSVPFCEESKGYAFSEGSGILIMENEDECICGKKAHYAEVIGYSNQYAPNINDISEEGLSEQFIRCMKSALEMAEITEKDIDFIEASAGGYTKLDYAEAIAIKNLFQKQVYVTSIQSYLGYARNVSGTFSTIAACLTLNENCIYPILTDKKLFLEDDIAYVKGNPIFKRANICLVNSFSYLGELCTLVLRKS